MKKQVLDKSIPVHAPVQLILKIISFDNKTVKNQPHVTV